MLVNNYKINLNDAAISGATLYIPLNMTFDYVDKEEIINNNFVSKEMEKAINPIIDYEKVRYSLINNLGINLNNIVYDLNFLNSNGNMLNNTFLSDIGFVNDDVKFRKSNFKESFLRLNFFDSDSPTNQKLLFFITIFCKLNKNNIYQFGNINYGLPLDVSIFPLKFILNNPETNPEGFAEGFYLYHFKDNVNDIFMQAQFNNAKTGKITNFVTTNQPQTIDNLKNFLYTKYKLIRNQTGFFYEVDNNYSTNVLYTSDVDEDGNGIGGTIDGGVKIKLFELNVI
jgi:hypothetical protein